MKLTCGQKDTLELIEWHLHRKIPDRLVRPLFDKLDKGIALPDDSEISEVMQSFKMIAVDYKAWIEDFQEGRLFLAEFNDAPESVRRLANKANDEAALRGKHHMWIVKYWRRQPRFCQ